MTLTKADIQESLMAKFEMNRHLAKDFVEEVFEEIRSTLASGDSVKIAGFGNFELRDKPARPGRDFKTGQQVTVSARRVVVFKPSDMLKEAMSHLVEKKEHSGA